MRRLYQKKDFPVSEVRRYLEPGPIVLVTSVWKGESDIMTMGWHTVMEFAPSLIGCMISSGNHSFDLIRKSGECVINVPTTDLVNEVVGIGNSSGMEIDKFETYQLTKQKAKKVTAPLIHECPVSFECKIYDTAMIKKYNFFIFEVVKAHAAISPKRPKTLHYTGEGIFMTAGKIIGRKSQFSSDRL